ncbi:MAG: NINE protein [Phascolarctobacterium sp.]|nr:NINE protein [Candidatus Phascolarctobacterium caballi]
MGYFENSEAAQQQNRRNKAQFEHMVVRNLDRTNKTAIIESADGENFYSVTLSSCTCPDFINRQKPCKHIYKLENTLKETTAAAPSNKHFIVFLLCVLAGYFGAHYFYTKRYGMGLLYLCTAGLFCFGWFYDIYRIASGRFCDKYGEIL